VNAGGWAGRITVRRVMLLCAATGVASTAFAAAGIDGGFGAVVAKGTQLHGATAYVVGARGGWVYKHTFVIGGGAYTTLGKGEATFGAAEGAAYRYGVAFRYAGVEVEYVGLPDEVVHYTLYTLVGGGFVDPSPAEPSAPDLGAYGCYVTEVALNGELNVLKYMRVAVGVGYRYTIGAGDDNVYTDEDLSAVTGTLTLKWGVF